MRTMKIDAKEALKLAMALASRVQIENVRLLSSSVSLGLPEQKPGLNVSLSHTVQTKVSTKGEAIAVIPKFTMKANPHKAGGSKDEVSIEAEFVLTYTGQNLKSLSPLEVQAFGQTNGIYNAWPYWREYVQMMTTRMGLPPLVIPVFRLVGPPDAKAEKVKKIAAKKRVT